MARGQTLNLRVDLESPGHPILNPGSAARVGFRGSWWEARAFVGPVRLRGESNGSKFRIVVTGNVQRHRARLFMTVALDRLSSCSSLGYRRSARQLTLRCLPPGEGQLRNCPI